MLSLALTPMLAMAIVSAGPQVGAVNTLQTPAQQSQPVTQAETKDEKRHEADIQSDISEGEKEAAQAEKQYKLSTNKEYQDRVQRIGAQIAAIANAGPTWHVSWGDHHLSKFNYTYKVIKGEDVNAFSLPGGHIYVFEGVLKQAESDDELAGVLAHETAHAAFRHVATLEHDAQKVNLISLPLILASLLLGPTAQSTILPAATYGSQAIFSGWSVKAEEAADYGGMQFLLKSKYDPSGMLTFMERMAADEKLGPNIDWGIFRDHPPSKERADSLVKYMTDAGVQVRRSKVTTSYRVNVHPADNGTVQLDFGKVPLVALSGTDALIRADAAVTDLDAFFDSTPELYEVQAGPDGEIMGKGRQLLKITPEDAAAAGVTVGALRDKALQNFRVAMFNLGFHVWASH